MAFDLSTYRYDSMAGLGGPRRYPILDIRTSTQPAVKSRRAELIARTYDPMAGLGGPHSERALRDFAARKGDTPKRGDTVQIRIGGVRRPVTINTIEELRDGSGFNINGTLPNGDGVEGFVRLEDMTLVEESPGDGRNKVAKSAPFRVGDTVRLREHQVVRVAKLEKVQPAGDGQLYIQASWPGGGGSGIYSPSQLSHI